MPFDVQSLKNMVLAALYDEKSFLNKYVVLIEQKTGQNRTILATGFAAFTALYLVFGYGGQLLCNFIGFVYPAYCSMKAIESLQKDDDTKWLTYWVVFAMFSLVEYFADFIVGWLPIYWLIKCVFLVWCFIPIEKNGSVIMYRNFIRPYFLQNQGNVENLLKDIKNSAMDKISGKSE